MRGREEGKNDSERRRVSTVESSPPWAHTAQQGDRESTARPSHREQFETEQEQQSPPTHPSTFAKSRNCCSAASAFPNCWPSSARICFAWEAGRARNGLGEGGKRVVVVFGGSMQLCISAALRRERRSSRLRSDNGPRQLTSSTKAATSASARCEILSGTSPWTQVHAQARWELFWDVL